MQKAVPEKPLAQQFEEIKKNPQFHNSFNEMQRRIQEIRASNPQKLIPVKRDSDKSLEEIIIQNRKHSVY
jgi:hypothetical protein